MIYAPHDYKIQLLSNCEERCVSAKADPRGINYNTGLRVRLDAKYMPLDKGRLVHTEWYAPSAGGEYNDLILDVKSVFEDTEGTSDALKRTTTRRYMMVNGDWGVHEKVSVKPYNTPDKVKKEGMRRRANIVNHLKVTSKALNVYDDVVTMLKSLKTSELLYIEDNDTTLIADISTYDGPWLDDTVAAYGGATIRQLIIGSLTI